MRFFTDRDLGKRFPHALRDVGLDAESHFDRYGEEGVPDDRWISEVTADGLILTHDNRIRYRSTERAVFLAAYARCFVFATRRPTPFAHMRALMLAWDVVIQFIGERPAPFMYGLSSVGRLVPYIQSSPSALLSDTSPEAK